MSIWKGPFQNLNWSLKNQKSELFLWNLMVKYWSDRVKFWIYTAFRAFQTSHQLLAFAVVYRLNREMRVWVKKEDALRVVPVLIFLLYMFLNGWKKEQYYNPPSKALVLFSNQFKSSKWAPVFVLNLKYWHLSKMISFLKCPLIPTFLLLIKARRCDQKAETFSIKDPFAWQFFCHIFSACLSAF